MRIRWDIRSVLTAIILVAGLLVLPACGSEGMKEAQAARNDAGSQEPQQGCYAGQRALQLPWFLFLPHPRQARRA